MGEVGLNIESLVTEILVSRSVDFKNPLPALWCSRNCEIFMVDGSGFPYTTPFELKKIGLKLNKLWSFC